MTLVSFKIMLKKAQSEHYGVGSFNVFDLQSINAVIQAAEEANSPVIMAFGEGHERFIPMDIIFPIMLKVARKSSAPIAVILDHGGYSANIKAMKLGVPAVMYDGSSLPFEKNAENTKKIVEYAHILGISVEAELGHVSMEEGNPDRMGNKIEERVYTDPLLVEKFVAETNVDALAISIGTSHGVCLKEPKIDFERLQAIHEITEVPLVLHGGSGVSDQDFRKCVEKGWISKINYFSNVSHAVALKVKEKLQAKGNEVYYQDIFEWSRETFKDVVKNRMEVFGSINKA